MRWSLLPRRLLLATLVVAVAGCATRTTVYDADLTRQQGVFVLGYTDDAAVRVMMEDRLVDDLSRRSIAAFASHADLPDLALVDAGSVRDAAVARRALAVILVNRVAADASDSLLVDPSRVTPEHPDLQTFFAESRQEMVDRYGEDDLVFVEVNLFLLDDARAQLYWSGTSWSFRADGQGTAVGDLSATIASQLAQVRERFGRAKTLLD